MKKLLLFSAFACLTLTFLFGQNRKMEMFEVNAMAEVVVLGKITSTKGLNFVVQVSEVVSGNLAEKEITVRKVKNSSTAKRWGKYVEDAEVMLFLAQDGDSWLVLGENGEGEKLVSGEFVFLDSRGGGLKNKFTYHQVDATINIYAEKVALADLKTALKDTKTCFKIESEATKDRAGLDVVERYAVPASGMDEAALDAIRNKSEFHELLISESEAHKRQ